MYLLHLLVEYEILFVSSEQTALSTRILSLGMVYETRRTCPGIAAGNIGCTE